MSPLAVLFVLYFLTQILTELLSNNAVAVVVTPVAIALALSLGLDPRPFVVAVMFAATLAFATPIGYQTNTMVYGPGRLQVPRLRPHRHPAQHRHRRHRLPADPADLAAGAGLIAVAAPPAYKARHPRDVATERPMAGHSKWANIQHRKGRQDAVRAKLFSKFSKEITVAARMGDPDPDKNPRLRLAVKEARAELDAQGQHRARDQEGARAATRRPTRRCATRATGRTGSRSSSRR